MSRRLLNLLTAVWLLLCLAAVALWAASYLAQPTVAWTEPQRLAGVGVTRGVAFFTEVRQPPGSSAQFGPPYGMRFVAVRPAPRRGPGPNALTADWQLAGFTWRERSPPLTYRDVSVPCWAVGAPLAVPVLTRLVRRRRRERVRRAGLCARCGYDLRATPERCPECGAAPAG